MRRATAYLIGGAALFFAGFGSGLLTGRHWGETRAEDAQIWREFHDVAKGRMQSAPGYAAQAKVLDRMFEQVFEEGRKTIPAPRTKATLNACELSLFMVMYDRASKMTDDGPWLVLDHIMDDFWPHRRLAATRAAGLSDDDKLKP